MNKTMIPLLPDTFYICFRQDFALLCQKCEKRKDKSRSSPYCKALILSILDHWTFDNQQKGKSLSIHITHSQWEQLMYGLFGRNVIIDSLEELTMEKWIKRESFKPINGGREQYRYTLQYKRISQAMSTLKFQPCEKEQGGKITADSGNFNDQGLNFNHATLKNTPSPAQATLKIQPLIEDIDSNIDTEQEDERRDGPPTSSTGNVNHSSSSENDSHFSERDDTSPSSDQEISDISPENVQEMSSTSVVTVRSEQSLQSSTTGGASPQPQNAPDVSSPSQDVRVEIHESLSLGGQQYQPTVWIYDKPHERASTSYTMLSAEHALSVLRQLEQQRPALEEITQGGVNSPLVSVKGVLFSSAEGGNSSDPVGASIPASARHEKEVILPSQDTTSQDNSVTTGVKSGNLEEITSQRSAALVNAKNPGLIFASTMEQTMASTLPVRDGSFPGEVLQCETNAGSHHPLPSLHDPAFPTAEPPIAVTPWPDDVPDKDISLPTSGQLGPSVGTETPDNVACSLNESQQSVMSLETVVTVEMIKRWITKRGVEVGRPKSAEEALLKLLPLVQYEAHIGEIVDIVRDQFGNGRVFIKNCAHDDVIARFLAIRASMPQKNGHYEDAEPYGMDATMCNEVIDDILDRNPQWESLIYLDETQAPVYFFGISLGNNEWIDVARRKDWDELDTALIERADAWADHLATESVELEAIAV